MLKAEERQQHLWLWVKNFFVVFTWIALLLAFVIAGTIVVVSPLTTHLARRQLQAEQDTLYIQDVCDRAKAGGHVGYGENDRCDEARMRVSHSPLKWAILDTADDWNLCRAGGCADIFFYLKLCVAATLIVVAVVGINMSRYLAKRALERSWRQDQLPSAYPLDSQRLQKMLSQKID